MIAGLCNDFLAGDLAFLVVAACHVNMRTAACQIEHGFTANAGVAAGDYHHFAIDADVGTIELPALDPFSTRNAHNTKKASRNLLKKEYSASLTPVYVVSNLRKCEMEKYHHALIVKQ